jgi:hypothetical protein
MVLIEVPVRMFLDKVNFLLNVNLTILVLSVQRFVSSVDRD